MSNFVQLHFIDRDEPEFFEWESNQEKRIARLKKFGFRHVFDVVIAYNVTRRKHVSIVLDGHMDDLWTESICYVGGGRRHTVACRSHQDAVMAKIILSAL